MPKTPSLGDLTSKVLDLLRTDWRAQAVATLLVALGILQWFSLIDVWGFIYRYQALCGTVLTGFFGFLTVNRTLRTNAENAQKQKDRERGQEAAAVEQALRAELIVIGGALKLEQSVLKSFEARNVYTITAQTG